MATMTRRMESMVVGWARVHVRRSRIMVMGSMIVLFSRIISHNRIWMKWNRALARWPIKFALAIYAWCAMSIDHFFRHQFGHFFLRTSWRRIDHLNRTRGCCCGCWNLDDGETEPKNALVTSNKTLHNDPPLFYRRWKKREMEKK